MERGSRGMGGSSLTVLWRRHPEPERGSEVTGSSQTLFQGAPADEGKRVKSQRRGAAEGREVLDVEVRVLTGLRAGITQMPHGMPGPHFLPLATSESMEGKAGGGAGAQAAAPYQRSQPIALPVPRAAGGGC